MLSKTSLLPLFLFAVSAFGQDVSCVQGAGAGNTAPSSATADQVYSQPFKPANVQCRFDLHTDSRGVIQQVLGAYGINADLDDSVVHRQIPFESTLQRFDDAMDLLKLATNTFIVPLDTTHALVLADTKQNRAQYERLMERKIAIPGVNSSEIEEMHTIANSIFDAQHKIAEDGRSGVIVRAPEAKLDAMSQLYKDLFVGHSELLLEVHVYEIDHSRDREAGLDPPTSTTLFNAQSEINSIISSNSTLVQEIISSGLASSGDYTAILAILLASGELSGTVFNNPFALFGGGLTETGVEWNTTTANLLLNSSDVKSLTQMQLRVTDHQEAKFRSGERYPVLTASYSALGGTSSSTVTVPQVQYQDLGLTLKVKPSIENEKSVALDLDLQVASLQGSSINDVPVLNNRQYTGTVDVHFGNSALITSAVSRQDVVSIGGYPIPGGTSREKDQTSVELVVTVTPHLLRFVHAESASPMWLLPVH